MELQKIDTSKWQWMMVSQDYNGSFITKRICFGKYLGKFSCLDEGVTEKFLSGNLFDQDVHLHVTKWNYAKPIEQRKNTALDVMWWGGVRHVCKNIIWSAEVIHPVSWIDTRDNLSERLFNELHLVNGHAELKHKKWLTYNELVIK